MSFRGVDIPPYWRVLPPAQAPETLGPLDGMTLLRIRSGKGFGIGTHETTQLCLLALGHLLRTCRCAKTMLDFGAGSGILAIAAALAGVQVQAVEIDEFAIENARENAHLNDVTDRIDLRTHLSEPARVYDLVFANILNRVLLDFAEPLSQRQSPEGTMVLSGLTATDVPGIVARYRPLLPTMRPEIYERGSWRAVVFKARIHSSSST
jgi:ribosomal protein L11 methyltransferase